MINKDIYIFDLDETLVSSKRRTPNHPDGTLNIAAYYANATRESIFKDTLLPVAKVLKWAHGKFLTMICSARDMNQDDFDFLEQNGLQTDYLIGRHTARKPIENDSKSSIWKMITEKTLPVKPHYFARDPILKERNLQMFSNLKQFKDCRKIFWDDAKPTIEHFSKKKDYVVFDAKEINKYLNEFQGKI